MYKHQYLDVCCRNEYYHLHTNALEYMFTLSRQALRRFGFEHLGS